MAKTLNTNVHVDGEWYGPGYGNAEVPDKIAAQITAPDVWLADQPTSIEDILGMSDEDLVVWASSVNADSIRDAHAAILANDDIAPEAKIDFTVGLGNAEMAGKARKGILAHLESVFDDLTAPSTEG
jgi:hypothetical protein